MKVLNVRLAVILLLCAALLAVVLHFVHDVQIRYNAYIVLKQAKEALKLAEAAEENHFWKEAEKQREAAVERLRWYVHLRPKDVDALEQLGLLLSGQSNHRQAFDVLEKALRLDETRANVRRELVDAAIAIERFPDARAHLERYLLKDNPNDPELLERLGKCQEAMLDSNEALISYEQAIEQDPGQVGTYELLADLLRRDRGKAEEADEVMRKLVRLNPKLLKAHLTHGKYLLAVGEPDAAMEAAMASLEFNPDDRNALWLATQAARGKNDLDTAREYAKRGIELYPWDVPLHVTLANIAIKSEQPDTAITVLKQGLLTTRNHPELLWSMANLLIDTRRFEEASEIVQQLGSTRYPLAKVGYLKARIKFVRGHWRAAAEEFERIRGDLIQRPDLTRKVDMWLGESYGKLQNTDQEMAAYRRAVVGNRLFTRARIALAKTLADAGHIEEALAEYTHLNRVPREGVLLWARTQVIRTLQMKPSQRDWTETEQVLDAAERLFPGDPDILILRSEILLGQGRVEEAETLLERARDERPEQIALWVAISSLAGRRKDWDRAEQILDAAEADLGDRVEIRIARAQCLRRRYGNDASEKLRKLADGAGAFSEPERLRLWWDLVGILLAIDDIEQVKELCLKIAEADPHSVKPQLVLFELALRTRDDQGIDNAIGQIEKIERGPLWRYGRAVRLTLEAIKAEDRNDARFSQALQLLEEVRGLRPTWERIPLLAAEIYNQQGRYGKALEKYLEAIDLGARDQAAIGGAVKLLYREQRIVEADELLGRFHATGWLGISPFIKLQQGKLAEALAWARKGAAGSADAGDFVLLGQILALAARKAAIEEKNTESEQMAAEAEIALSHATELASKDPAPWLAMIRFLASTHQQDKALAAIERAKADAPSDQADFVLARCHEALGDKIKARHFYEKALQANPDDPLLVRAAADFYLRANLTELAEAQFRRIIDSNVQSKSHDAAWARQQLAILLDGRNRYQDRQAAIRLIRENLESDETNFADRRLLARLTAHEPGHAKRDEAIGMFETLIRERPDPFHDDLLTLVSLYLKEGNPSKARDAMRRLLAMHGDNPAYVAEYVRILLKYHDFHTAERWLSRLEELAPRSFLFASLRAEHQVGRQKYEEAIGTLLEFIEDPEASETDSTARILPVAARLAELGRRLEDIEDAESADAAKPFLAEAEKLYRKAADNSGRKMMLAGFLARTGKIEQALDIMEDERENTPLLLLGQVCNVVVNSGDATRRQYERVAKILDDALKQHNRAVPLLLVAAGVYAQQKRYDDAESVYREIIEKDSENVIAMNNLAVLLALQDEELEEASRLIDAALEIAGPMASMLDSRATVYTAMGESDKAIADIENALADGRTPLRLFHLARAYDIGGRSRPAMAAFMEAEELGLKAESVPPLERPAYDKLKMLRKQNKPFGAR